MSKATLFAALAFNLGCEARLAGCTPDANPFLSLGDRQWFGRGWRDVDQHWGAWVWNKRQVRPLPMPVPGVPLPDAAMGRVPVELLKAG